jgi:hypothetical protein
VKKETPFKFWLKQKWFEHLDELESWGQPRPKYDPSSYFQMYKWWLKREYRFQKAREQS